MGEKYFCDAFQQEIGKNKILGQSRPQSYALKC